MKLRYFAWLHSKLGKAAEDLSPPSSVTTVGHLLDWLETLGPTYKAALSDRRIVRVAVNQEYAGAEHPVAPGDEIALFPPVTGG
jgi:molybdopterin synthase sulfur carrier subunit